MNIEMNQIRIAASLVILALLSTASFSGAQAQQPSEEQVSRILKRFPEADKDKDGKLSPKEFDTVRQMFQFRQRNRRSGAAAQPMQTEDAKPTKTQAGVNATEKPLFSMEEILDESTLDINCLLYTSDAADE